MTDLRLCPVCGGRGEALPEDVSTAKADYPCPNGCIGTRMNEQHIEMDALGVPTLGINAGDTAHLDPESHALWCKTHFASAHPTADVCLGNLDGRSCVLVVVQVVERGRPA